MHSCSKLHTQIDQVQNHAIRYFLQSISSFFLCNVYGCMQTAFVTKNVFRFTILLYILSNQCYYKWKLLIDIQSSLHRLNFVIHSLSMINILDICYIGMSFCILLQILRQNHFFCSINLSKLYHAQIRVTMKSSKKARYVKPIKQLRDIHISSINQLVLFMPFWIHNDVFFILPVLQYMKIIVI